MNDVSLDDLQKWVGREERKQDDLALFPATALAAALNRSDRPCKSDALPPFWEWLYFLPTPTAQSTGADGHPARGGFLPPVPLPRRMWAAGSADYLRPLKIGAAATRVSRIESVERKEGASGTLVFVEVSHEFFQHETLCIRQQQTLVYRQAPSAAEALPPARPLPGKAAWSEPLTADPVLLFRYSALTYNSHRIHFDRDYATGEEWYPSLVVHGPLLVTLLLESAQRRSAAPVSSLRFQARRPTFEGQPFWLEGCQKDDGMTLWTRDGENAPGMIAQVRQSGIVPATHPDVSTAETLAEEEGA